MINTCTDCKKIISKRGIRCKACANRFRAGKYTLCTRGIKRGPLSEKWKKNIHLSKLGKKWNHPMSEEQKQKLRDSNLNINNGMWKGDKVSYGALHTWIRKNKLKPNLCENCKRASPYDIANISGKYKRDIHDYKWICRRCHMIEDKRINNLLRGREKT